MEFGKTSLIILKFLPRENFQPKVVVQDKQIITAIGFAHQEFARKVILSLGLEENTDNYFKEQKRLLRRGFDIYSIGQRV